MIISAIYTYISGSKFLNIFRVLSIIPNQNKFMDHNNRLFIIFIVLFVISCTQKPDYIVQIDLKDYWPDTITSMTVEESQERSVQMIEDVMYKTVGKEIPPVLIFTLSGDSVNLKEILDERLIIISCDAHCGFSDEHALNDFQKALKKLNDHDIQPKVICLLVRFESDIEYPERFNDLAGRISAIYEHSYIIDENQANELNLIGGSCRLVVNEDHVVESVGMGISIVQDNRIFDELYAILK